MVLRASLSSGSPPPTERALTQQVPKEWRWSEVPEASAGRMLKELYRRSHESILDDHGSTGLLSTESIVYGGGGSGTPTLNKAKGHIVSPMRGSLLISFVFVCWLWICGG